MKDLFRLINSIPFVGKYKTVTGGIGIVVGTVLDQCGIAVGETIRYYSEAYMGLGLADKARKRKTNPEENANGQD